MTNSPMKGWKNEKPNYHQRTVMLKECGKKCFLGKGKSYPICKKNTCKKSKKGLYSAYARARQHRRTSKNIAKKAKNMLNKM